MATCSFNVPDKDASGDNFYGSRISSQKFRDWAWKSHGFKKKYWDQGFGFEDPSNTDLALARTFNAIWLLNYSYSPKDESHKGDDIDIIRWAGRYVYEHVDELQAKCGKEDGPGATAKHSGWNIFDKRVELYLNFFYGPSVVVRAGLLLHEARHMGGKSHNAKFPKGSCFGEGKKGADSDWGYYGAWTYEVLYLWSFSLYAVNTTQAMRDLAKQEANSVLDNAFAKTPTFRVQ
jgi:hypothetical protein